MQVFIALTLAALAIIQPAYAFAPQDELVGVPFKGLVTIEPGGAEAHDGKLYYTAPGQEDPDPIRCRGPVDTYPDTHKPTVEWRHCWHENSGEPVDKDADRD